jgi:hypothetical protein
VNSIQKWPGFSVGYNKGLVSLVFNAIQFETDALTADFDITAVLTFKCSYENLKIRTAISRVIL